MLFIERYSDDAFRVEPTFKAIKKTLHEIVAPGDSVTVSIDEQGAGTGVWQISIKNNAVAVCFTFRFDGPP